MKNPRMSKIQRVSIDEEQSTEEEEQQKNQESGLFHPWEVDLIVVNGQPMTVTFPREET